MSRCCLNFIPGEIGALTALRQLELSRNQWVHAWPCGWGLGSGAGPMHMPHSARLSALPHTWLQDQQAS